MSSIFSDLTWATIRERHQGHWTNLRSVYGLPQPTTFPNRGLEQIASDCVNVCSKYLLPQSGMKEISLDELKQNAINRLLPSLVNHLLVSFSYHFYYDNLQSKTLREYWDIFFDCTDAAIRSSDNISETRNTFCNNGKMGYNKWIKDITAIQEYCRNNFGEKILPPIPFDPHDALLPPNWPFALVSSKMRRLSGPYQICNSLSSSPTFYFISFLENKRASKSTTLVEKLTSFLTASDYISLLVKQDTHSTYSTFGRYDLTSSPPPTLDLRMAVDSPGPPPARRAYIRKPDEKDPKEYLIIGNSLKPISPWFTALPWDPIAQFAKTPLPTQSYAPKDNCCEHEISISQELQLLFNSYLLELSYHAHALATVMNCPVGHSQNDLSPRNMESFFALLAAAARLRAPISHAAFIEFVHDTILWKVSKLDSIEFSNTLLDWENRYIDQLNATGLPILEEYFLWNICEQFTSAGQIFSEVDHTFSPNGKFSREDLLFFRLLPLQNSKTRPKPEDEQFTQCGKKLVNDLNLATSRLFLSAINICYSQIGNSSSNALTFRFDIADHHTVFD